MLATVLAVACSTPPSGALVAAGPTPTAEVELWVTTGDRAKLLQKEPNLAFAAAASGAPFTIVVDESRTDQEMVGFGGAITGSSAWLIQHRMNPAQRQALLEELFSPTLGIGMSFARLTIGASDFSLSHYSYHDVPPDGSDPTLQRFSLEPDRGTVLPVVKQALAINPQLRVIASPWSAPGWMKTSGRLIGGRLRPEAYDAFALYLVKYIRAMAAEGVPIWAITIQNEPHHEPDDYPGMRMEQPERARFIGRHLGPLFERERIGTLILEWDHNWDEPNSPLEVLDDPAARRYVDGVAWHCYAGEVSAQSRVRRAHPDTDHYFTECSGGAWATNFGDNLKWNLQNLVIGSTRHGSRGVLLWNLALDPQHGPHTGGCDDCRGVVTIDPATGRVVYNEEFYALAHASKFVRQGARRVASSADIGGLQSVAFRNPDGSRVLLVLNTAAQARSFDVRSGGRFVHASLPAGAVATYRWP